MMLIGFECFLMLCAGFMNEEGYFVGGRRYVNEREGVSEL